MKRALLDRILRERAARKAFVVATRLADGEQVLIEPDQDESPSPELLAAARAALASDRAEPVELADGAWLVTPYNPPIRLYVIGAVHIAQALVPMARLLDLAVTVIDPRRAFGTLERFPGVTLLDEFPEAALARLGLDRRTALVALTHDKKLDDPAIALALRSEAFYVGALGSKKTQAARNERLMAEFSEREIARIHGPIGLPIGARTPAEVAVAILAELVSALRRGAEHGGAT